MSTESGESLPGRRAASSYEPPRIEHVLGAQDLEREVLYAGTVTGPTTST